MSPKHIRAINNNIMQHVGIKYYVCKNLHCTMGKEEIMEWGTSQFMFFA